MRKGDHSALGPPRRLPHGQGGLLRFGTTEAPAAGAKGIIAVWDLRGSYGYSNPMGYQTSDFRLLWTIPPNPQHPSPP